MTQTPPATPLPPSVGTSGWTRAGVEMLIALAGVRGEEEETRVPTLTWQASGPGHWLGLFGYRVDSTEDRWWWVVETKPPLDPQYPYPLETLNFAERAEAVAAIVAYLDRHEPPVAGRETP